MESVLVLSSAQTTPEPGTYEIWARATDGLGRRQPLDGTILPAGVTTTSVGAGGTPCRLESSDSEVI
jgi:hypothetical protein